MNWLKWEILCLILGQPSSHTQKGHHTLWERKKISQKKNTFIFFLQMTHILYRKGFAISKLNKTGNRWLYRNFQLVGPLLLKQKGSKYESDVYWN